MTSTDVTPIERVQLGVRMEKSMVKVLKGLAEFEGITLGQLLEKIVLHSFEPVPGDEGESCASPHGKRALAAIATGADVTATMAAVDADISAALASLPRDE